MPKITNDCLIRSGTESCTHKATVGVKGLISPNILFSESRNRNYSLLACCCLSMNDEDAVLARKQTDGENEDDSGARILTRRFCHRYDNEDRMLEYL